MRLENKPQRTRRVLSSHFLNFSVIFVWKLYITNYGRNLSKKDKDKTKHFNQTRGEKSMVSYQSRQRTHKNVYQ